MNERLKALLVPFLLGLGVGSVGTAVVYSAHAREISLAAAVANPGATFQDVSRRLSGARDRLLLSLFGGKRQAAPAFAPRPAPAEKR